MKAEILNFIICPHCGGNLRCEIIEGNNIRLVGDNNNEEIKEGVLRCKSCGRIYPVINYVPRLVPETFMVGVIEKHREFVEKYKKFLPDNFFKETNMNNKEIAKSKRTVERFGYEWKNYPKLFRDYEAQFLDWIYPLTEEFFKNKKILDAGCGTGRHVYFSAKFGANTVIDIDLSEAVEVAYENTKEFKNVHIIQADIYNLPFKKEEFDFVYSIGVLHHLPYPEEGFRKLLQNLRNGGAIFAWVYGREGNFLLRLMNPVRKNITSRIPIIYVKFISAIIMLFLHPFVKFYGKLSNLKITRSACRKLPQNEFFKYLSKFSFEQNTSILFDQLIPPIANYYTKQEFEEWFKNAKLKNVRISQRNKNSWRGFGEK